MCKWGITTAVRVYVPADLSATGRARWREKPIDSCIADIVEALQNGGINMRGSCCGHGDYFGVIILQDGRMISLCRVGESRSLKWALRLAWQIVRNWRRRG